MIIDEQTYEAVYLDFLEGNLSESESAMFLQFLEANPLLKLDDELFCTLKLYPPTIELDASFKEELRSYSEDVAINDLSIHHFLIAELEGCLSESKLEELQAFILLNPTFKQERNAYTLTRVPIDEKIVFEEKQSLKKQQRISFFNYLIYAAASVLFFVLLLEGMKTEKHLPIQLKNQRALIQPKKRNKLPNNTLQVKNTEIITREILHVNTPFTDSPTKQMKTYHELKPREINLLAINTDSSVIEFHTKKEMKSETDQVHQLTKLETLYGNTKNYKNPIKSITSLVSVILKKNIDVRMSKQTLKQSDYLFIKIGRLQVYRQKRTENSEGLICFRYDE